VRRPVPWRATLAWAVSSSCEWAFAHDVCLPCVSACVPVCIARVCEAARGCLLLLLWLWFSLASLLLPLYVGLCIVVCAMQCATCLFVCACMFHTSFLRCLWVRRVFVYGRVS
jgi:hypothetical protein